MIRLSDKNKDKLIGGLIGAFLLGLTLFVEKIFSDNKPPHPIKINSKSDLQTFSPVITSGNKDNTKQTIIQIQQQNKDNGKITNEFVSRTKNITQIKMFKNDSPIINNGFINSGGNSNVYNQTINPATPQRHFTPEYYKWFLYHLPKKAKALSTEIFNYDEESIAFANETMDYFEKIGYTITMKPGGTNIATVPKEKIGKFDVLLSPDSTFFKIIIYPLK